MYGVIAAVPAIASETSSTSRFHLITSHCEAEVEEGPEATPQSPPLEVDDPGTPGCNRWEINVVVGGDIARSQAAWELPLLDINYGIGDNLQLKYELPFLNTVSDGTSQAAIGESRAGIKYQFFGDEDSKLALAIYPQLTLVQANADAVLKGLASPGVIVTLPLLLSRKVGQTSLGEVDLTANFGYNISTKADTADFVSASAGVGTALSNRVAVMGELTTEQGVVSIENQARAQLLRADAGMMTTISRQFLLFGAVGRSLVASDEQDHTYILGGIRLISK